MRYDIESLCADIQSILTTNLNTKISAINTEKNDSISLASLDSNAYFFQTLDGKQVNYDPYIFYGIEDIEANDDSNYGMTSESVIITVAVIVADEGTDIDLTKRLLRYQRALKEIFEEGFNSISEGVKIVVKNEVPISLQLQNSSSKSKAIGVSLRVAMA